MVGLLILLAALVMENSHQVAAFSWTENKQIFFFLACMPTQYLNTDTSMSTESEMQYKFLLSSLFT